MFIYCNQAGSGYKIYDISRSVEIITCKEIELPDYFTRLMRVSMQASDSSFKNLARYVAGDRGFNALVTIAFSDMDKKIQILDVIKSFGWHGFRDRMASLFIYKRQYGVFPKSVDSKNIRYLLELEDKLKKHTTSGYSRGFLLGFYLEMSNLSFKRSDLSDGCDQLIMDDDLIELLSFSGSKVVEIDWLFLILVHFDFFLGRTAIGSILKNGVSYQELYGSLGSEQKNIMMRNMMAYGGSIGEPEMFFTDYV